MKTNPKQKPKVHICIIGDSKCGKTSLIKCFLYSTFTKPHFNTIINTIRVELTIEDIPFDVIITEMGDYRNSNEQSSKDFFKSMGIAFICYKLADGADDNFNEETIKKHLIYIYNSRGGKDFIAYIVGCQLDKKTEGVLNRNAVLKDGDNKLSDLGQRMQTFSSNNKISGCYLTSSLLNFNIQELFNDAIVSFAHRQLQQLKSNPSDIDDNDIYEHCFIV